MTALTTARSDAVTMLGCSADAPDEVAVDVGLDIGGRGRIGGRRHRVLVVAADADRDPELPLERVDERGDRPVARARDLDRRAVGHDRCDDLV